MDVGIQHYFIIANAGNITANYDESVRCIGE